MSDETTVAPAPVSAAEAGASTRGPDPVTVAAAVAPGPATAASAPAGPGRTRRATGLLGQVVGIVGIVVCLALIVGVLLGRGWATEAVSDVAGSLDAAVARTEPLLETAVTAVSTITQQAGETAAAAEAVAADPAATPEALQRVVDRLGAVSQRYLEFRGKYAGAREQVVSALDRLGLITRFVPGVSVPEGPVDALAGLDERARELDARVMGLIEAGGAVQGINAAAAAIAEKARQVEASLGTLTAGLTEVQARLDGLRAEIAGLAETVNTIITIAAIVLVIVLLYIALLHLVLFRASRAREGGRAAA